METIFFVVEQSLSITDNMLLSILIMSIISYLAKIIAYEKVKETGLRGFVGKEAHWAIRVFTYTLMWFFLSIIIILLKYIFAHLLITLLCLLLLVMFIVLKKYADRHQNSFLNKEYSIFCKGGKSQ